MSSSRSSRDRDRGMNVLDLTYRLTAVQGNGEAFDIDDALENLSWEEYDSQLAVRFTASLKNAKAENGKRAMHLCSNGVRIRMKAGIGDDKRNCFEGIIFRNHTANDRGIGRHEFIAYDPLYPLIQSDDDRYYPAGKTATDIIEDICRDYSVPHDLSHGPTEKLSKKAFKGRRVAEMCAAALHETRKKGGGSWMLQAEEGKAVLNEHGKNKDVYYFATDEIQMQDVDRSIEDLITVVKIVGRSKDGTRILATARAGDLVRDYGTIQRLVDRSSYNKPAGAEKAAKQLIEDQAREQKTRTVVAPDIPWMRRGWKAHVESGTMNGFYIAKSVIHDPRTKTMTMTFVDRGDEPDYAWKETGLDDWIPPEDRNSGGGAKGGVSDEGFMWPAHGPITGNFGDPRYEGGALDHYHEGIDIGVGVGTAVVASRGGTVTSVAYLGGYGNQILISHPDGWQTRYAHLSSYEVRAGQKVDRGQLIARSGDTGTSTGPHLHFETIKGGRPVDPLKVLP